MVRKAMPDFSQSKVGTIIDNRQAANRDLKAIVTARSAATGVGKTTLAVHLCRYADRTGSWNAEDKAHVNMDDYVNAYLECPKGSSLLPDEIEHGADARRAMSGENVRLSHAWAQLRYRNVTSVATLPSTKMLDDRLLMLSDLWINVIRKGVAIPYYIWINDFTGEINRQPLMRNGSHEIIRWEPIDDDEDYKVLQEKKDQAVRGDSQKMFSVEELEKKVDNAETQAEKGARNEIIGSIYESTDVTQADLADALELDQASISRIVNQDT